MRRTPVPTMALVCSSLVLSAPFASAQTAATNEVPPPPPAPRAPSAHLSWAERYANRSMSLIVGFGAQHEPYADQGAGEALALFSAMRFVVARGIVIEPEFSTYYGSYTPPASMQPTGSWGVRPGLRLGYVRALADRVALTVEGGYRLDRRMYFSGYGLTSAEYTHELVAQVAATIFLTRNFFLEESIGATVDVHSYGVGFGGGVSSQLGVTF
jgi:hypothetical protein